VVRIRSLGEEASAMAGAFRLSALGDEAAGPIEQQCEALRALGLRYIEVRAAGGRILIDSEPEVTEAVARAVAASGLQVSAYASPLGKVRIDSDLEEHRRRFRRALEVARRLGTDGIRIFSFNMPAGTWAQHRDTVLREFAYFAAEAGRAGMRLLVENERGIYGDVPERCLDLVEAVGSPHVRLLFDPANFLQCGVQPYPDAWERLRAHVGYVHVKDAVRQSGEVRPAGEGDGRLPELFRALSASGYTGFLSLEPHLKGEDRMPRAVAALRRVLDAEGLPAA
jgi:sugar phosphate isomerase/epimerase